MGLGKFLQERLGRRKLHEAKAVETRAFRIVAGLGNPGKEYTGTRHNVGYEVLDLLAESVATGSKKKKFGSLIREAEHGPYKLILMKPQEFMNRSGQAVATAAGFYKVAPADILIIADDMALEPGKIRIRASGSAGGHNGLADIIEKLGTSDVARLRVGIGKAPGPEWRDWVLTRPSPDDRNRLDAAIVKARDAAMCWIEKGITAAMNGFNAGNDVAKQ